MGLQTIPSNEELNRTGAQARQGVSDVHLKALL